MPRPGFERRSKTLAQLDLVERELRASLIRAINLVRWRFGIRGRNNPLWGACFQLVDRDTQVILRPIDTSPVSERDIADVSPPVDLSAGAEAIQFFVRRGISEPLGHSLLREAWNQLEDNPRSALVIGIATAEVGFKQFVAEVSPQVATLIEDLQSPPLKALLSKHFPVFMQDHREFVIKGFPRSQIVSPIDEAAQHRNTLVHKSPTAIERHAKLRTWLETGGLEGALWAISDLLWLLDYYRRHHWALEYVRAESLSAWSDLVPTR
jgi:hypothetical protein